MTPQPRQRLLQVYREEDGDINTTKIKDIDDLTGVQYFVEEAAREDDINDNDNGQQTANNNDVNSFNKLLHYCRQLLRLL
eukprot:3839403-Amphidinium_carterae.1